MDVSALTHDPASPNWFGSFGEKKNLFPPPARNWAPIPKSSSLHILHRMSHATTPRFFK
jgi:hypothetical protein